MKHRSTGTASGAEQDFRDFVQETLAKAYSHWRKVQRADSPSAYVRRILINESRRGWRRSRHVTVHPDAEFPDVSIADEADAVVNRAELLQALQSLTARQRATVALRFLEGLSERETAAALGCSEGTVKSQTSHHRRWHPDPGVQCRRPEAGDQQRDDRGEISAGAAGRLPEHRPAARR